MVTSLGTAGTGNVKVYTVSGGGSRTNDTPGANASSATPAFLQKSLAWKKKRRRRREDETDRIELIQDFEFPEASNKIEVTPDGKHAIATGTYKPQMRVYDLYQLAMKFERHTDAENVDFKILSDDWTKTVHLQADRSIELHTQAGFHYRTRIPRFGRSIAYHFPSCDALISASGNEVYRLNLDHGRFLSPYVMGEGIGFVEGSDAEVQGVNVIDINPAHQLLSFGTDGPGTVELWDPRSRRRAGLLSVAVPQVVQSLSSASALPAVMDDQGKSSTRPLGVTALASRSDGLTLAAGTSTGHVLLYDLRSPRPFTVKDQGYGLPIKTVQWTEGSSRHEAEGKILSADAKVIKIWDKNTAANLTSITPTTDINCVHHVSSSGLIMMANEGVQMTTYYIPQLGPAPRWCSFLDNVTEELEENAVATVYDDYKFVDRKELASLGMEHLVGTALLKPYMHGFFVSLPIYNKARLIANPTLYAEHKEKVLKEQMEKQAESRIKAKRDLPKVNKQLAETLMKKEEKERRRTEKRASKAAEQEGDEEEDDGGEGDKRKKTNDKAKSAPSLLKDERFAAMFENPEFEVDDTSREFALLNPSTAASGGRKKTAVEEEEEESERGSSDDDEGSSENEDEGESGDSSDEGDLGQFRPSKGQPRERDRQPVAQNGPPAPSSSSSSAAAASAGSRPRLVDADGEGTASSGGYVKRKATFGERMRKGDAATKGGRRDSSGGRKGGGGDRSISFIPSGESKKRKTSASAGTGAGAAGKVERFGHGLEKGGAGASGDGANVEGEARFGRQKRRSRGEVRSASKNVFRGI